MAEEKQFQWRDTPMRCRVLKPYRGLLTRFIIRNGVKIHDPYRTHEELIEPGEHVLPHTLVRQMVHKGFAEALDPFPETAPQAPNHTPANPEDEKLMRVQLAVDYESMTGDKAPDDWSYAELLDEVEVETLRIEYQEAAGKPADGRWKKSRLVDEISKIKGGVG